MKTLFTAFLLFCCTATFAQQYVSTSTGEIPVSSLTQEETERLNDRLYEYREGISSGAHCYTIINDSGTWCRTKGIITDYNVFGRRWAILYNCTTWTIIAVWEI